MGGAVRDALLGHVSHDLDFAVPKDAIAVARKAADRLVDVLYFERDDLVMVNAMKALKFSQDPRVVEPLVKALRSGNARIRWQAIDSLEGVKAPASIEGIREIADDPRERSGDGNGCGESREGAMVHDGLWGFTGRRGGGDPTTPSSPRLPVPCFSLAA